MTSQHKPDGSAGSSGPDGEAPPAFAGMSCESGTGVHFTIHVRERAVACTLPRQALLRLSGSERFDRGGGARFDHPRSTVTTLAARQGGVVDAPRSR